MEIRRLAMRQGQERGDISVAKTTELRVRLI